MVGADLLSSFFRSGLSALERAALLLDDLTENNGENLIVCIGAGGGDFLMVHYFHMNADKWCTDRAALSMASIQQMDA